jgi:hypothetical protein
MVRILMPGSGGIDKMIGLGRTVIVAPTVVGMPIIVGSPDKGEPEPL